MYDKEFDRGLKYRLNRRAPEVKREPGGATHLVDWRQVYA